MIEAAYQELAAKVAAALVAAEFIPASSDLKVDPSAPFEPTGDERTVVHAAAIVNVRTYVARQLLGVAAPRYVVERECRVELAAAGPARLLRLSRTDAARVALAVLPALSPTLDGKAERLTLGDQTDDELPPNGLSLFLTFTIRVRSGDPLGLTP